MSLRRPLQRQLQLERQKQSVLPEEILNVKVIIIIAKLTRSFTK